MLLRELFYRPTHIAEGGNLELPGGHQAQHIDLKVHDRNFIVPLLNNLLHSINGQFAATYKVDLWDKTLLQSQKFLSGSSLHFFNTSGIDDQTFVAKKPRVGDIDTMVNKDLRDKLAEFLVSVQNKKIGPATFLGYKPGNEQFTSLWEFHNPPIKIQIDFEFVEFALPKQEPTDWARFSHSSSWEDLQSGVKGVFHKYLIQSLVSLSKKEFLLRKLVGRGKARAEQDVPTTDNMLAFAVSSKEGGGLRAKYEPALDDNGKPIVIDGLDVMRALPASGYEQNIENMFSILFGHRFSPEKIAKMSPNFWSFTGLSSILASELSEEERATVARSFTMRLFGSHAQGLYKGDPKRDAEEKTVALDKLYQVLNVPPLEDLDQLKQDYFAAYKVADTDTSE